MAASSQQRNRVVVLYNSQDRPFAEELQGHLAAYNGLGVDLWDDRQLEQHAQWRAELAGLVAAAQVVIVLISVPLVASALFNANALPPLLGAALEAGATICPVIVDSSAFGRASDARYRFANTPWQPLREMEPSGREAVWKAVDEIVRRALRLDVLLPPSLPPEDVARPVPQVMGSGPLPTTSWDEPTVIIDQLPVYSTGPLPPVSGDEPTMIQQPTGYNPYGTAQGSTAYPPAQSSYQVPPQPQQGYPPPQPTYQSPPTIKPPQPGRGRGILGGIVDGVGGIIEGVADKLSTSRSMHIPEAEQTTANPPLFQASDTPGDRKQPTTSQETRPTETPHFTAFYPKEVTVETWNTLLVYTHVAATLAQVQADAQRVAPELFDQNPREITDEAQRPVARGTALKIVPRCKGITFNPTSQTFNWLRDLHRASFDFLVSKAYAGRAGDGEITIYAGPLIIGTIPLALLFEGRPIPKPEPRPTPGKRYQQIFASYSHRDTPVVLACRNAFRSLGWEVLIDIDTLRSGQVWSDELMRMIDRSDIFQLFWSEESAKSVYVRQEWEYALDLTRGPGFIRPVYWELPLVPPPPALSRLHFAYQPLPKLDVSLSAYDQAIQTDPANPVAYRAKGDALVEQGKYAEALPLYDRAIQLAPRSAVVYSSKSTALYALGRYEEALAALDQTLQLNPRNALAYTRKVAALSRLKRFPEALAASDQAIALEPYDASTVFNKGSVLINLARYEEAVVSFEQAIRLSPGYGRAYRNLGVALERLGRQAEAKQAYRRAWELGDRW